MSQELRLTPEERDRVLDLAARLQARHEATIAVDDLAQAAEASGIEARFVHEAVAALRKPERLRPRLLGPAVAFVLFTIQAALYLWNGYWWSRHGHSGLEPLDALGAAMVALPLALWAARSVPVRRFVPLAPAVVWVALAIPVRLLVGHGDTHWIVPTAFFFGFVQTLGAMLSTFVASVLDRPWRVEETSVSG